MTTQNWTLSSQINNKSKYKNISENNYLENIISRIKQSFSNIPKSVILKNSVAIIALLFLIISAEASTIRLVELATAMEAVALLMSLAIFRLFSLWPRERAALMLGSHLLVGLVSLAAYMVII